MVKDLELLDDAFEKGEILFHLFSEVFPVEPDGGVIADEIAASFAFDNPPARFVDALDAKHLFCGDAAQKDYKFRVNKFDLLEKIV